MKNLIFILLFFSNITFSGEDPLKSDLDIDGVVVKPIPIISEELKKCSCSKKWLDKARSADLISMFNLARCFGVNDHKSDFCESNPTVYADWMGAAATRGFAPAQYAYGTAWFYGAGVKKTNKSLAIRWWAQAASLGLAVAYYSLGDIYENGIERKKDLSKALLLFKEAEKLGHKQSSERIKKIESIKNK